MIPWIRIKVSFRRGGLIGSPCGVPSVLGFGFVFGVLILSKKEEPLVDLKTRKS